MTIDTKDMINSILESISRIDYIRPEDLPGIDLYMDQVTTFMEAQLASTKRNDEDKILTKTMINNYAKNHLIPSPDKKKYSKEHLLLMIFIYYFKNILSINDIKTLMEPITEKYFQNDAFNLESVYSEVFSMTKGQIEYLKKDLLRKYRLAQDTFNDVESEADQEYLRTFSFIGTLCFDVYAKKLLIEKLIDNMNPQKDEKDKKKKK